MSGDVDLDSLWQSTLQLLHTSGWPTVKSELKRRLDYTAAGVGESATAVRLILGTLEQKFGELSTASRVLRLCRTSNDPAIARDARLHLAKVLSQMGEFDAAHEELSALLPPRGSPRELPRPDEEQSAVWRMGLVSGLTGELSDSSYWFSCHSELASGHGSKLANNLTFSNLVDLANERGSLDQAHERNLRAIDGYLADGLSVEDVKYVSIAKSVVVPLLHEAVLLLSLNQAFDGLVQVLLCRRLLQFESLSLASEGVAEAVHVLARTKLGRLPCAILERLQLPETLFLAWLKRQGADEPIVVRAVGEAEDRFRDFLESRDYQLLTIVSDRFPSVTRGSALKPIYFSWNGAKGAGLEIGYFLSSRLGLKVITSRDPRFIGLTRSEIVAEMAGKTRAAVIHLTSITSYEAGAFRHTLGAKRVVFLKTSESTSLEELGLSAVQVNEDRPSECFERLRQFVERM